MKNNLYQKSNLINTFKNQQNYKIKNNKRLYIFFKTFKIVKKILKKILNIYKSWKYLLGKEIIIVLFIY